VSGKSSVSPRRRSRSSGTAARSCGRSGSSRTRCSPSTRPG